MATSDTDKHRILPQMAIFERASAVDYYKGEERVAEKWPKELLRGE